jgi:tetratricopeptide (TPR) repeat protein
MEEEEKLQIPQQQKDEGNALVATGNYQEASKCYSKALLAINYLFKEGKLPSQESAEKMVKEIQIPCLLNLALCYLKLKICHENVVIHCSDALKIEPNSIKGLYRRSMAYLQLGQLDEAKNDLQKAIKLEPNNLSLREGWEEYKRRKQEYKEKERKRAQTMFKFEPEIKETPKALEALEAPEAPEALETSEAPNRQSAWLEIVRGLLNCCRRRVHIE